MDESIDYLALQASRHPASIAVRELASARSWTYSDFDRAAARCASALRARGVGLGDRVAALAKNRAELLLLHFGCVRLGAIYVPLNWRLSVTELETLVADAEPSCLFTDASVGAPTVAGDSLEQLFVEAERLDPLARMELDQNAPSLILYTSGTSGRPKGVLLSERNLWETARNFSMLGQVSRESVVLCDSPMFHVIGLVTNTRPALMHGGRLLISDGFVPGRTLSRLGDDRLGVTHYFCVPQMAAMLRAEPGFDPSRLRGLKAIFSGGAPHAPAAIRSWVDDGIVMADGFGMSEAGTVSCMPLDLDAIGAHAGAAGTVPASVEIRVVDGDGAECPTGQPGELLVRGSNVTGGYWRRPEETRAAIDADGWFRTGDIAKLDARGFLWLVDRKKDMFISGGENVYPAEIERALAALSGVAECAVVGVGDDRWGEVGHLFVVPAANRPITPDEILGFLTARLARYKIPKHFSVLSTLPRNGAGKVLKSELRGMPLPEARPFRDGEDRVDTPRKGR